MIPTPIAATTPFLRPRPRESLRHARLVGWLETLPPNARVLDQIKQMPDSMVTQLIRRFANNELVLKQADSAKIQIDPAQLTQLHGSFANAVRSAWAQLGVTPASLRDSAKSEGDREKLAAKRINDYFARMIAEQAPFVPVPTPLSNILRIQVQVLAQRRRIRPRGGRGLEDPQLRRLGSHGQAAADRGAARQSCRAGHAVIDSAEREEVSQKVLFALNHGIGAG